MSPCTYARFLLLCCAPPSPQAQRIEVKISEKDEQQKSFWLGLGFQIHDDIAEMRIDAALHGRGSRAPAPLAPTAATGGAASSSKGGGGAKKRSLTAAKSVPAAASSHQPSPQLPPTLEQHYRGSIPVRTDYKRGSPFTQLRFSMLQRRGLLVFPISIP